MFFDAKQGSERKSARAPAAKGQQQEQQEQEVKLEVNKAFAEKFAAVERLKDGMRLKSLEEQYGSDGSSGTPSSSSDEGSIDEEVDNTLIKTLEMITRKDPAVYDKNFKAFPDDSLAFGKPPPAAGVADCNAGAAETKQKKSKSDKESVTLKDYFRAKLLAASDKGHADLDEIDRSDAAAAEAAAAPASYHEEAAAAKKAFLTALGDDQETTGNTIVKYLTPSFGYIFLQEPPLPTTAGSLRKPNQPGNRRLTPRKPKHLWQVSRARSWRRGTGSSWILL